VLRATWWLGLAVLVAVPLTLAGPAQHHVGRLPGMAFGPVTGAVRTAGLLAGVLALSVLVAAAVLPSRLSWLNRAFGIERVLRGHRRTALIALYLVLAHVLLVLAARPADLRLLDLAQAPPRARAAVTATIGLALLCWMAQSAKARRQYTWWRISHVLLALSVLLLSGLHILWLNHLVRDDAMRLVFVAIASGLLLMLAWRWLIEPLRARTRPFVVEEVRLESDEICTLVLAPKHGYQPGVRFAPGQFAWIRLDHPFSLREEHPFTIASGAHDHRRIEFTIRQAGDFTRRVRQLEPGRLVYLDGPHGSFSSDHVRGAGAVLIAAGVGITPMISMLRTFEHRGDRREHVLIYAASDERNLLFTAELDGLQTALSLQVLRVVSRPGAAWTGLTGRVDDRLLRLALPVPHAGTSPWRDRHVFICGPAPMVLGTVAALQRLKVPASRIHTELFDLGGEVPAAVPPPAGLGAATPGDGDDLIESWTQAVTLLPRDLSPDLRGGPAPGVPDPDGAGGAGGLRITPGPAASEQSAVSPSDPTVPIRHPRSRG